MHGKTPQERRKRAVTPQYINPNQLTLSGFETPFEQALSSQNRWVKLAAVIPWNKIVHQYDKLFKSAEGRPPISGRIVIGAIIIKHMLVLTDRETVDQIRENMFMQYFLGYSSFTNEEPFSPTLFVSIRERLTLEVMSEINDAIIAHASSLQTGNEQKPSPVRVEKDDPDPPESSAPEADATLNESSETEAAVELRPANQGKLLMDATVAPQYITFPTDLKVLNASLRKSEELIDLLYDAAIHGPVKVRTYRRIAHKRFLNTAKKKQKTSKEIYKANGSQLRFLRRNLGHLKTLVDRYNELDKALPLNPRELEYLETIRKVYEQQHLMHTTRTHVVPERIVNIHQPHVRPKVRGKDGKKVELGSKLQVSLINGFTVINKLSWESFNEGHSLRMRVEEYRKRFGYYPAMVLADKIYCNRENRRWLKELGITLHAKALGRPGKEALYNHVRPGERNPIEGKFGQGKVGYGLDSIKAKLKTTSESWITTITLVLNLVNLTRLASHCFYRRILIEIKLLICPNYWSWSL